MIYDKLAKYEVVGDVKVNNMKHIDYLANLLQVIADGKTVVTSAGRELDEIVKDYGLARKLLIGTVDQYSSVQTTVEDNNRVGILHYNPIIDNAEITDRMANIAYLIKGGEDTTITETQLEVKLDDKITGGPAVWPHLDINMMLQNQAQYLDLVADLPAADRKALLLLFDAYVSDDIFSLHFNVALGIMDQVTNNVAFIYKDCGYNTLARDLTSIVKDEVLEFLEDFIVRDGYGGIEWNRNAITGRLMPRKDKKPKLLIYNTKPVVDANGKNVTHVIKQEIDSFTLMKLFLYFRQRIVVTEVTLTDMKAAILCDRLYFTIEIGDRKLTPILLMSGLIKEPNKAKLPEWEYLRII